MASSINGETRDRLHRFTDVAMDVSIGLDAIAGLEETALVSIEKAIEPIIEFIPDIYERLVDAKGHANSVYDGKISIDEITAINLYTMEWIPIDRSLYYILNKTLREQNRNKLRPWFLYLRLILTGLARLPNVQRVVYRVIKIPCRSQYEPGILITWWAFSSCSTKKKYLEESNLLSNNSTETIFEIHCLSGKEISKYSFYEAENEILLCPGVALRVIQWVWDREKNLHNIILYQEPSELEVHVSIPDHARNLSQPVMHRRKNFLKFFKLFKSTYGTNINEDLARLRPKKPATLYKEQYTLEDLHAITTAVEKNEIPTLILRGIRITEDGVRCIGDYIEFDNVLKELYLDSLPISDTGAEILGRKLSSEMNSTLALLSLNLCAITDEGAKHLALMVGLNSSLRTLSLARNQIHDSGIESLMAHLAMNKTLTELSLEWNRIERETTVRSIINMLKQNQTLSKLQIHIRLESKGSIRELRNLAKNKPNLELTIS